MHSVVFGVASNELAVRINDAQPKVIITASCGIEVGRVIDYKPLLDGAIELSDHKPAHTVIKQRPQKPCALKPGYDLDWDEQMAKAQPAECVPVAATDPLYILYTSGTTGQPRRRPRQRRPSGGADVDHEEHLRHRARRSLVGGLRRGLVVGHSYIVYAPLFHGATTILYEGKPVGTPDAGAFWRVIAQHKVRALFTAPTAFRAIKRDDPNAEMMSKYDLSQFRILFLAGERTDPDTLEWAEKAVQRPVIDHWWQTETGWAIAANCMGLEPLPVKPGSPTKPVPGWDVRVLDETNKEVARGQSGAICVKLPLPPGTLPTLWNNDAGFVKSYLAEFPGYYMTADAGFMDEDGYVYIMARTDDVINVAGHRLDGGHGGGAVEAPGCRRMRGRRGGGQLQGPVAGRLHSSEVGGDQAARSRSSRKWCRWSAIRSGRSPRSRRRPSSTACRRPGRARSCAARSRRSPITSHGRCRRQSTIRPFWTRSRGAGGHRLRHARREAAATGAE